MKQRPLQQHHKHPIHHSLASYQYRPPLTRCSPRHRSRAEFMMNSKGFGVALTIPHSCETIYIHCSKMKIYAKHKCRNKPQQCTVNCCNNISCDLQLASRVFPNPVNDTPYCVALLTFYIHLLPLLLLTTTNKTTINLLKYFYFL